MTFKCFSINMPLSLFTLSDQFPPVQINWANVKEPGTEGVIYTQGKELDDLSIKGQIFFFFKWSHRWQVELPQPGIERLPPGLETES